MLSSILKVQIHSTGRLKKSDRLMELKQGMKDLVDLYIGERHVGKGELVNQNGHYAVRIVKKLTKE